MSRTWAEYFMAFAHLAASRSEDTSTQVGCVIVGPDRDVRATGYNGMPRGVRATWDRLQRPTKYLYTSHAEVSAVGNAARSGTPLSGCTAYVTHHPCDDCTRLLIQAGITRVVVGSGLTSMPPEKFEAAQIMLKEAGIELAHATP